MRDRYILNYILDEQGQPQPCEDILEWGRWFQTHDRVVKQDYVEGERTTAAHTSISEGHGVGVSTVFLGLDHNYTGHGPPILWESMVFGTALDGEMRRYESKEAAIRGHEELLAMVSAAYAQETKRKDVHD